jgi:hypothetical protein
MKNEVKAGYQLILPNGKGGQLSIELRELDESTYIAVSMLAQAGKEIEATKEFLKALHSGGDKINEVLDCFPAVLAARGAVLELITPLEYQLKKK